MINNRQHPRRGAKLYWVEGGVDVYVERIVSPTNYFVFEDEERKDVKRSHNINPEELFQPNKPRGTISSVPKALTTGQKLMKNELNMFFATQALRMPETCQNCDKPLYAINQFAKRCVTAHILPKAEFPELATNENNVFFLGVILLGVCDCHDNWDRKGAAFRSTMKCYTLALEAFKIMRYKLSPKQLIRAFSYLNIQMNDVNAEVNQIVFTGVVVTTKEGKQYFINDKDEKTTS